MDTPQAPIPRVYTHYAFTAQGKSDPIAALEKADGEDVSPADAAMSPEQFNRRLRRIAPARGRRFNGDLHDTCMVVERSKNLNLVLYTANMVAADGKNDNAGKGKGGGSSDSGKGRRAAIDERHPLRECWIKLEPEHVARRRGRGETEDICELGYLERKLAYGCSTSRAPAGKVASELKAALKQMTSPLTKEQEQDVVPRWDEYFTPCLAKYVATPQWPVLMLTLPPVDGCKATTQREREKAGKASSFSRSASASASTASPSPSSPSPSAAVDNDGANKGEGEEKTAAGGGGDTAGKTIRPGDASYRGGIEKDVDVGGDVSTAPGFAPEDTVVVMLAVVDGQLSLLKKVYVTSVEPKHFYQLPSVSSLEAFGVSVATGEETYEKRKY